MRNRWPYQIVAISLALRFLCGVLGQLSVWSFRQFSVTRNCDGIPPYLNYTPQWLSKFLRQTGDDNTRLWSCVKSFETPVPALKKLITLQRCTRQGKILLSLPSISPWFVERLWVGALRMSSGRNQPEKIARKTSLVPLAMIWESFNWLLPSQHTLGRAMSLSGSPVVLVVFGAIWKY